MGLVVTEIRLRNPKRESMREMTVNALVDTGALHLCIPQHIATQLDLDELYKRDVATADRREYLCSYVGPIEVRFENRACFTGAIVLGDEVLLGAVPMEDMDVVVSPAERRLIVNPKSPNIPFSVAKGETSKSRSKSVSGPVSG